MKRILLAGAALVLFSLASYAQKTIQTKADSLAITTNIGYTCVVNIPSKSSFI